MSTRRETVAIMQPMTATLFRNDAQRESLLKFTIDSHLQALALTGWRRVEGDEAVVAFQPCTIGHHTDGEHECSLAAGCSYVEIDDADDPSCVIVGMAISFVIEHDDELANVPVDGVI